MERLSPKQVGRVQISWINSEDLTNVIFSLTSLALGVNGWVQEKAPRLVLSLACHQCSICCKSGGTAFGAEEEELGVRKLP